MAIGRISGPLLKANLLREGVNLAFENDLLYLDVNNNRIGINNATPQYDLDVVGTTRSPQLEVSTSATIGNVTISGTTISTSEPTLTLGAADNVVYQNKLIVDSFTLENNVISTNDTNTNIEFNPNGTGTVEIFGNTNVTGNIVATGNITADGNITIGDADTDNIVFNAEVNSNIIPDINDTFTLGSVAKNWADVRTQNFFAGTVTTTALTVDGVDLALRQGNIYYVSENGLDSYSGDHPNDPFGTIKHALSQATTGDTIHIYPGVYQEIFPMTVPTGVTVKGHSIRGVNITPTAGTNSNDAFLLNGGTSIEDLTISGYYTGYAFKLATGFTVAGNNRSPYIRNVTVITQGSVTSAADPRGFAQGDAGKGAYIDGAVASSTSLEATMLFNGVTFITPGVDALTATNGARVEWLNSFTYFANRGIYAADGATGLRGTGQTGIRVDGLTGSIVDTNTFSYYDTDGVTVLATGTINGTDADGKFYVDGNLTGLVTAANRGGKTIVKSGTPTTDTGIKKFGTSSLELDGATDYLSVAANNDFGFGTSNYAIDGWFYITNVGVTNYLFDFRGGAATDVAPVLYVNSSAQLKYYSYNADRINGPTLLVNTWYHIAVSRSAGTTKLFVNGTSQGTPWVAATDYGSAKPLVIGATWEGASFYNGRIDEFRVTKGLARFDANFVAPTSELASDSYTKLMLHFNNAADGSSTIIDDTLAAQDIRFSNGATANYITLADQTEFGAEIRSVSSACVYGNYGVVGDGPGVLMYLISQNLAYVGAGKEFDNDNGDAIQANEVVETNNAKIRYSSVDHKGDFRVGDLFYVNQADGTVDFASSTFNINTSSGVTITTGSSQTTITGDKIDTGNLRISGNTVSSLSGDIILNANSGTVRINSTSALQLPKGNTASRPTPATGMIRYNTETSLFEGYDGNWMSINGVYDLDLDTRITAELTPGSNDNTIRFYISNSVVTTIDANKLETPRIEVDHISIDGNTITTETADTDLLLSANGTGSVIIDNIAFKDSTITNTEVNGILNFQQEGSGYFKIEGSNGFVVPVGNNVQRPASAYRETGMTRYNTEQRYMEIWDGFSWVSVAGATGSISFAAAEDLAIEYILTLG
jgi:hypothetical protein|tara:strand:- start:665 stop:3988 length:3324 start_codon:yes stop_codon:yes gene_type:complete